MRQLHPCPTAHRQVVRNSDRLPLLGSCRAIPEQSRRGSRRVVFPSLHPCFVPFNLQFGFLFRVMCFIFTLLFTFPASLVTTRTFIHLHYPLSTIRYHYSSRLSADIFHLAHSTCHIAICLYHYHSTATYHALLVAQSPNLLCNLNRRSRTKSSPREEGRHRTLHRPSMTLRRPMARSTIQVVAAKNRSGTM